LERSPHINRADVELAMAHASGIGRMLVAGGHLEREPLTLVAGELRLEVTTVSGNNALDLDENLNPVPGGGAAESWTVHLPACPPLDDAARDVADGHDRLSAEAPPAPSATASTTPATTLDEAELNKWARGDS
jgi:hypothetical protein